MTYEASLTSVDGSKYPACVVTGYPVIHNRLELIRGQVANKDDWNKLIMATKMGTSTESQDILKFISVWGGGSPNMSFNFQ